MDGGVGLSQAASPRIAILGAGMSGLGVAAKLKEAGYEDITIFEKSDGVGGTWRDNTYPGCGCDVPSHLYSYSFHLNPDWDFKWSLQSQILQYFEDFARDRGLLPHCRFKTEITACRYDDAQGLWRLTDADGGVQEAEILISGLGQLNIPRTPDFPGKESFQGPAFHSARWDHSVDLDGKTVAVIGNGPSAVQFLPEIAPRVGRLINFQRSPAWCRPRGQRAYTARDKALFRAQKWRMRWYRWRIWAEADFGFAGFYKTPKLGMGRTIRRMCEKHLADQVKDPELRDMLTPDFQPGCKRILISDDYYPALCRDNVTLLRRGVSAIEADGVVDDQGERHPCDVIIYATGFQTTDFLTPMEVHGAGGLSLNEAWRDGAEAYRGVAVSGFPNFFMLYGPNTNLGHNSIIFMVEQQIDYVLECVGKIAADGVKAIDVTPEAMAAYNHEMQTKLDETVWAGECGSWYKNEAGRITNNWSGPTYVYRRMMHDGDFSAFRVIEQNQSVDAAEPASVD